LDNTSKTNENIPEESNEKNKEDSKVESKNNQNKKYST